MLIDRRTCTAALSLTTLGVIAPFSPLRPVARALAQNASDVAKQPPLPDMALGPADASVTIVEYAATTCVHCAAFNREVFPRVKLEYIDSGKVRYVFREFPLNITDIACAMLTRRIANGDSAKYFAIAGIMFNQQDRLAQKTTETLKLIGKQAGLGSQAVEDCLKDRALMDKLVAGRQFAMDVLKVAGTPTFFINGEIIKGETSFEEFDKRIKALL